MCISGGASSVCFEGAEGWESVDVGGGLPRPTLRGSSLWLRFLQAALQASPSLAVVHDTPSPMAGLRLDTPSAMAARCRRRGAFFVVARRAEALDALASSATMARQSCRLSALASLSLGIL